MSNHTQEHSIGKIRELLLAAFAAGELRRFYLDRSAFRPIVGKSGPVHGLDDMLGAPHRTNAKQ